MKKHTVKFFALIVRSAVYSFIAYCCVCWWICDKYAPPTELPEDKTHVPLKKAVEQPAYFDGSYYHDTLVVTRAGHPMLDLLLVPSFQAIDRDGIKIQVFRKDQKPEPSGSDTVVVWGVFWQVENNYYFRNNCCILAVEVKVLPRNTNKSAKQVKK